MFLSAEATHLTAPAVLVTLYDVSPSADQNMARHNRPLAQSMAKLAKLSAKCIQSGHKGPQ